MQMAKQYTLLKILDTLILKVHFSPVLTSLLSLVVLAVVVPTKLLLVLVVEQEQLFTKLVIQHLLVFIV